MAPYHFLNRQLSEPKMGSSTFSLPTSTHSGHPIFPTGNYQPPSYETARSTPSAVDITSEGTWKPAQHGHPTANIEILDLTGRFGYNPTDDAMKPKTRPKNALKKGLRPTRASELPPLKRTVHEISSDEDADDDGDVSVSDSPSLRGKRHRNLTKNGSNSRLSMLEELQAAAANENGLLFLSEKPPRNELTINEAGRVRVVKTPRPAPANDGTSGLSTSSSRTVQGTYEVEQQATSDDPPSATAHTGQGMHEVNDFMSNGTSTNQATAANDPLVHFNNPGQVGSSTPQLEHTTLPAATTHTAQGMLEVNDQMSNNRGVTDEAAAANNPPFHSNHGQSGSTPPL
ncbi:MAG: hypothetical protein L6R39_005824, partial [Caloplaca ligustica]